MSTKSVDEAHGLTLQEHYRNVGLCNCYNFATSLFKMDAHVGAAGMYILRRSGRRKTYDAERATPSQESMYQCMDRYAWHVVTLSSTYASSSSPSSRGN